MQSLSVGLLALTLPVLIQPLRLDLRHKFQSGTQQLTQLAAAPAVLHQDPLRKTANRWMALAARLLAEVQRSKGLAVKRWAEVTQSRTQCKMRAKLEEE
eukprot:2635065-Amphidinium_carterae.1